ncbi:epimerase [Acrocarpospora pleiomorpha]|uniref:Epimerase n=1 Tax=Acrocarpospora pleiomorpha TaxID=90975 RepID=A0A5M3XU42_9ACTN|nr:NAD-dependent epimerase/dehydratase family protein [Acrocarpospora pleiomorpha]GES24755.1 epimerase [Acrocarpospora pleiomorpha]
MRVLITGGAGFIGANLCAFLTGFPGVRGVVALDDLSTGSAANLEGSSAELVEGSILDRPLLDQLAAAADTVVHLAARPSVPRSLADPVASHDVNATGTMNVLEACRASGAHLILASSSSVYGDTEVTPKHEDLATRPLSPYGASKLAAEAYTLAYGSSFGLPVLPLRFFNVYGPLQAAGHAYAAVIPAFVDAALRGEPVTVHGDGEQTRDFTYVGTVVRLLADAALRRVTSPAPVNLAFGTRITVNHLVTLIGEILGKPPATRHVPARVGDVRHSQAACDQLTRLFPSVDPVPLGDGLKHTVAWFERTLTTAGTV